MQNLSIASQLTLYGLLALIGLFALLLLVWQIRVLRGEAMPNPDGSIDDWRQQKILFGLAFADVLLVCPATLAAIALAFLAPRWGHLLLAMIGFWLVYINFATTATSLRFETPKITLSWLLVFPAGAVLGLAYLAWAAAHFDAVFAR
ncbi:MAG: hypothetical protein JSU82_01645 [Rhodospirillales bacterium]|nr:MAG: hypothetical protein JSU82_01645 [Rhodospirillales bacterium]